MIPVEVIIIPLYVIVRDWGWVNTWYGLFIPGIANGLVIFMFRQFFADIPQEILDAARVDGASWGRILFQLIVPISMPAIISGALVLFLASWNSFFWPLVVAPAPDYRVVQVAVSLAVEERQTFWVQPDGGSYLGCHRASAFDLPLPTLLCAVYCIDRHQIDINIERDTCYESVA